MQKKTPEPERPVTDVRADDPKRSMDRLKVLTRRVLKVPKERLDEMMTKRSWCIARRMFKETFEMRGGPLAGMTCLK